MLYGYARVSTKDQKLAVQTKKLLEKGVKSENIFKEKKTGRNAEREELQKLLAILQPGDKVVSVKIDRIARSLKDGLSIIEQIQEKGASLEIMDLGTIDDTPMGRLILSVMLAIAQFEVDMNKERQTDGIALAKAQGKYKGKPKMFTENNPRVQHALEMYRSGQYTIKHICSVTGLSKSTLYRIIEELGIEKKEY